MSKQLVVGRRGDGGQARDVGDHHLRREVDPLRPRRQPVRKLVAAQRTEVDASRARAQLLHGDAAVAASQEPRDQQRRARGEPGALHELLPQRRLAGEPGGGAQGDLAEDLPVVALVGVLLEDRGGEPRGVAHGQQVEDQVVVVALEGRRRRQDHVGVPRRLVDVDVDRHHEVQPAQRLVEPRPVRRGEHRVAGHGEERADLSVARASRSPRAAPTTGSSPPISGRPRTRDAPRVEVPAPDQAGADDVDRRRGEHHAARPVEVAGEEVEAVDGPLAHGAERLRGDADPAVDDAAVGRRELAGETAHDVGRHAAHRLGALGGEVGDRRQDRVQPVDVRPGRAARSSASSVDEHVQHREQHRTRRCRGARSGARRRPSRSRCGAGRATTIRPPRACSSRSRCGKSGTVIKRAVGGHRVGADDQEPRRCGRCPGSAGTAGGRTCRCATSWWGSWSTEVAREAVAGPERLEHRRAVGHRAEAVRVGVAEVDAAARRRRAR